MRCRKCRWNGQGTGLLCSEHELQRIERRIAELRRKIGTKLEHPLDRARLLAYQCRRERSTT